MDNGLKYKDNILVKAILAKALQFNEFREILLATGNLSLIHPKGGSSRNKHSELAYPQMIVRKIINENAQRTAIFDRFLKFILLFYPKKNTICIFFQFYLYI